VISLISAFEEEDGLQGNTSVGTTIVLLWNLAREQMRGRPDIGIVAGTFSKAFTAQTYN
jgi:hypothetical protein